MTVITDPEEGNARIEIGDVTKYNVVENVPQCFDIDLERLRITMAGAWLGKIFGSAGNAPTNIAGLILCLFFRSMMIVLFLETRMEAIEYLKLVLPVITLVLGYLFGRST